MVARGASKLGKYGFVCQFRFLNGFRREFLEPGFLLGRGCRVNAGVIRDPELRGQFPEMFSGIFAGARGDFGRQQVHNHAIFIRRPHRAVAPQKTRSGAFLAAETQRTIKQPRRKPFKPYGHFAQRTRKFAHDSIDEAATDQSFADGRFG